jgi:hypothetical protein
MRLRRFPENRFVGTRDDMVVYDCDDAGSFATLEARIDLEEMTARLMVSTFGPDTLAEARNRGFSLSR